MKERMKELKLLVNEYREIERQYEALRWAVIEDPTKPRVFETEEEIEAYQRTFFETQAAQQRQAQERKELVGTEKELRGQICSLLIPDVWHHIPGFYVGKVWDLWGGGYWALFILLDKELPEPITLKRRPAD